MVSTPMPFALELCGLVKHYRAGAGSCRASLAVLRGVDLTLDSGELVAVSGAHGSGTSTLLLCAAGLLRPDAGDIAWFGDRARAAAVENALYIAATGPARRAAPILLVDAPFGLDAPARAWLARRRSLGNAILLATHDEALVARHADRCFQLREGVLHPAQTASARVAERAWRGTARVR